MSKLTWDQIGDKTYETGVSNGVLYLQDASAVSWNGITEVAERFDASATTPLYFEGVKYHEIVTANDFNATLKAFTYPDEFLEFEGMEEAIEGLFLTSQPPKLFGLAWQTKIGTDVNPDAGYKLHVACNLRAIPVVKSYKTISSSPSLVEFEWQVSSIPARVPGFRPTAHLVIDSTKMDPALLLIIEDTLYGTDATEARLPSFVELIDLIDFT